MDSDLPSPPGPAAEAPRARTAAIAAAIALGALALYARVASYPFIYFDDTRYVLENATVRRGLSWSGAVWAFTTFHASNWHPLTWLSHMLDVQLFGLDPGAHHLVNAGLHAANAALLFLALARMTGAPGRSAAVAALFAVHPLHVESVAWIAERKELLGAFFGLLALHAYARYAERPGARRYALVALAFALSLLAKPTWVTLPFLLLLLDVWPLRRLAGLPAEPDPPRLLGPQWPLGRLALEKLPLLALSAASSAVTVVAQVRGGALTGTEVPLWPRAANAALAYAWYLAKSFWPTGLAPYYPHHGSEVPALAAAGATALLAAVTGVAAWQARRLPWLAVGWFWYLGTLVPMIGLVQVGSQAMADRYTYLPLIGFFIAAVWGAHHLASIWRLPPLALRAGAAVALAVLSGLAWRQLGYWRAHDVLFRHALAVTEDNGLVHGVLSEGLRRAGRLDEALPEALAAVRIDPASARHWNNLAATELELGRLAEAREAARQAIGADPRHASSWVNLGEIALRLGDAPGSAAALEEAVRLDPAEARAWNKLGNSRLALGDAGAALAAYREAVRLQPDYAAAWNGLATLSLGLGLVADADAAFHAAARAGPDDPATWRNLGVFLARVGRGGEAADAFRRALRLKPGDADLARRLEAVDPAAR